MTDDKRADSNYSETGTLESGYSEQGPFHCGDCIHLTGKGEPFCLHFKVVEDPQLRDKLVMINNTPAAKVDLQHGCCRYVRPESHEEENKNG